ncbi:Nif11-like leader peptide family natural product precursor [Chlorobium sp. N1]|uniref:Nif11-like leader peptide family natural product precursor n=1 Tax=Chlorobium sp. N1 TaxID=2491138 RepID=UPI00103F5447|nr:Nif11-like leader peptide family natural product precursor [Chlorobium sp. N1]TCD47032.1 Nif11-like leader peptide family natural product precursor [Chlorobium sp. N1]
MSREQATAFIERMKRDEAFHRKVMAIEDAEERMACIQHEGYACTPEEINELVSIDADGVQGAGEASSYGPYNCTCLSGKNFIQYAQARCGCY